MSQSLRLQSLTVAILLASAVTGCQQKMADQPAPRPYEAHTLFPNKQSARLLEQGTIHIGQLPTDDPLLTWLTAKGKSPSATPEWKAAVDPNGQSAPSAGAPTEVANFVEVFPFDMTEDDLKRGQQRYNIYCAVCHGTLGNGKGKIWERGFLKPTSYHTEKVEVAEPDETAQIQLGFSRGFWKWDVAIPVRDVPVGYIFEVISKGYGAMPDHASQIKAEDRWRIIAYVRTLQFSRRADVSKLPQELKQKVESGAAAHAEGHK